MTGGDLTRFRWILDLALLSASAFVFWYAYSANQCVQLKPTKAQYLVDPYEWTQMASFHVRR